MKVVLELDGVEHEAYVLREADRLKITIEGESFEAKLDGDKVALGGIANSSSRADGPQSVQKTYHIVLGDRDLSIDGRKHAFRIADVKTGAAGGEGGAARGARIKPPMPGKIVSIGVKEGDEVKAGQVLLILEAMKMQNEIPSPAAGVVKKIHVKPGQNVEGKDLLVELE